MAKEIFFSKSPLLWLHQGLDRITVFKAFSSHEPFKNGVNLAISLSVWDYIFRTNYVPKPDKNLRLGYSDDAKMPQNFWRQMRYGFRKED